MKQPKHTLISWNNSCHDSNTRTQYIYVFCALTLCRVLDGSDSHTMGMQLHLHFWGGEPEDPQGPIVVPCCHTSTVYARRRAPAHTATGLINREKQDRILFKGRNVAIRLNTCGQSYKQHKRKRGECTWDGAGGDECDKRIAARVKGKIGSESL